MDSDKMKDAGLLVDGMIQVTIKTFNPWHYDPYQVTYKILKSDGEIIDRTYNISETYLIEAEIFPEFKAFDPKSITDDNLPF